MINIRGSLSRPGLCNNICAALISSSTSTPIQTARTNNASRLNLIIRPHWMRKFNHPKGTVRGGAASLLVEGGEEG